MRNEVIFQDFEPKSETYYFTKGDAKKIQYGQMTSDFATTDTAVETIIRNTHKQSIEVQVDSKAFRENGEQVIEKELDQEQTKRLSKFLKRMEPIIIREIEEGLSLKAYQNYEPQSAQQRQDTKVIYSLQDHSKSLSSPTLCISDVSWNSTGMVVAASYGEFSHEGSCNHRGAICTWSIFKREFKTNAPQIIQTNGCINCISFHPVKPSLFVCGTYSGEILLYDLAREDDNLIARSRVDDYLHREIISRLVWWEYRVPGSYDVIYNLLSLGTDGRILLWDMRYNDKHKKQLLQNPIKGFSLVRKKEGQILPVGGLAMEMSLENKNLFIVGSEGGSILRATLSNIMLDMDSKAFLDNQTSVKFPNSMYPFLLNLVPENLPEIKQRVEQYCAANKISEASMTILFQSKPDPRRLYPNAVNFAYEPSPSPVISISCNQYGLFVVNGCEGSSRIYQEGYKPNLESIDGGFQIKWVVGTKLAGFFDQEWIVFDWLNGDILTRINAPQGIQWMLAGDLAALGYDKDKVKVVRLGSNITEPAIDEEQKVRTKIAELKGL